MPVTPAQSFGSTAGSATYPAPDDLLPTDFLMGNAAAGADAGDPFAPSGPVAPAAMGRSTRRRSPVVPITVVGLSR